MLRGSIRHILENIHYVDDHGQIRSLPPDAVETAVARIYLLAREWEVGLRKRIEKELSESGKSV